MNLSPHLMDVTMRTMDVDKVPYIGLCGYNGWVRLVDVYDGDTITVVAPLGRDTMFKVRVRLLGIDTPELRGGGAKEKEKGLAARDALIDHLTGFDASGLGRTMMRHVLATHPCIVWVTCKGTDKYGRALCVVYNEPQAIAGRLASANDFLVGAGHAYLYNGGTRRAQEAP